jgi:hypothetical protein
MLVIGCHLRGGKLQEAGERVMRFRRQIRRAAGDGWRFVGTPSFAVHSEARSLD